MSGKNRRAIAIRLSAMEDFVGLPLSARRLLAFCVERMGNEGLARVTLRGACTCLHLSKLSGQKAMAALREKDFIAQAGRGLVVLNMTKVDLELRDGSNDEALLAKYRRDTEGWAYSRARKSAASKAMAAKNPGRWSRRVEGGTDGLVETTPGPGDGKTTH